MKLDDYQSEAIETAIYPEKCRVYYPALGLFGEVCEFFEKKNAYCHYSYDASPTIDELGDVLWYIAVLAADLELWLSEVAGVGMFSDIEKKQADRQDLLTPLGKVAGLVKKAFRDAGGHFDNERRWLIAAELNSVLRTLAGYASILGTTLGKTAELNLEKLASRKERGVLKGDGDTR
jgi:NTP pyrophosphatase (non-canonical NTP hydrolase)